MMRQFTRRATLAVALPLCAAIASGCATGPVNSGMSAVARPSIAAFELEGRLSASDGARAASGALTWNHGPGSDQWTVYTPLGNVAAQLVRTPNGASLLTADGRAQHAEDADTILPQLLGVSAPLDGLQYWVQASPRAGARILSLDEAGRPARVADAGWIIDYPEYAGPAPDAPPRRIDASWGDARIRLIIDQWTPLP